MDKWSNWHGNPVFLRVQLRRITVLGSGGESVVDNYRTSYGTFLRCGAHHLQEHHAAQRGPGAACSSSDDDVFASMQHGDAIALLEKLCVS